MFRTRKRLIEAEVALARRDAELELLRRDLEDARTREREASESLRDEQAKRRWAEALHEEDKNRSEGYQRELAALRMDVTTEREARQKAEVNAAVFRERLDLMTNVFPAGPPIGSDLPGERKYVTEEEEDLAHMAAVGLLDKKGLEAALEQAGLTNAEIDIDFEPRDYPRLAT